MARRTHRAVGFRAILSGTFALLVLRRKQLAAALLAFAMLSAVLATGLERKVQMIEDSIIAASGLSSEQLHSNVDHRLQVFTPHDAQQVLMTMKTHGLFAPVQKAPLTQDEASLLFVAKVGPWIVLSFLLNAMFLFIACIFFLMLAGSGKEYGYEIAKRLPLAVLRMLALSFWILVRSLLWIPLIGPIVALYMLPRLLLAPVFVANEEAGIFESVHRSMKLTSGLWFPLFLTLLCLAIFTVALLWFAVVIVVIVTLFSTKIGFLLWLLSLLFTAAMQMFFLTVLTVTLE